MARGNPKPDHTRLPGTSPLAGPKLRPGETTTSVGVRGQEDAIRAFKALSREARGKVIEAWFESEGPK